MSVSSGKHGEAREWAERFRDNEIGWEGYGSELHEGAELIAWLLSALEAAEERANEYRIEADCGLRDFDALELDAGILREALETIAAKRPNQSFDPWAVDVAQRTLDRWHESRDGNVHVGLLEAAGADARQQREDMAELLRWTLEHVDAYTEDGYSDEEIITSLRCIVTGELGCTEEGNYTPAQWRVLTAARSAALGRA